MLNLSHNPQADKERALSSEIGWLYYRFDLSIFPVGAAEVRVQEVLVNQIQEMVHSVDGIAELVAEF